MATDHREFVDALRVFLGLDPIYCTTKNRYSPIIYGSGPRTYPTTLGDGSVRMPNARERR
jgi:hypothetical protein